VEDRSSSKHMSQDSQNAKRQFGPELRDSPTAAEESVSLASRDWLGALLQVTAVQLLLVQREARADHYGATLREVPVTRQGTVRL
jgi:hypothetical protein